ncbi:MAG: class I SAM-dependent methyltransferase [Bacteroidota bacterium]
MVTTTEQTHRPITPHSILTSKLQALEKLMRDTSAYPIYLDSLQECLDLATPLDHYIAEHTSSPSEDLDRLEAETNAIDWDGAFNRGQTELQLEKEMVSGAVEGQFLQLLTSISGAKRILEIGSFTGYASLAMAEALPDDGKLIALEYDQFTADFAKSQWEKSPHGSKIEIKVGDAIATLRELAKAKVTFDLVFIDADKTGYLNYYKTILEENLIQKGGLICVDNTLFMGQVYGAEPVSENGKALEHFNQFVRDDERVQQVLLPLRDGVTLIRRVA